MLNFACESITDLRNVRSLKKLDEGTAIACLHLPSGDEVRLSVCKNEKGKFFGVIPFCLGDDGVLHVSSKVRETENFCGKGKREVTWKLWHKSIKLLSTREVRLLSDKESGHKQKFHGTLVITDPCYLGEKCKKKEEDYIFADLNEAEKLSEFGLKHFDIADTIYGDWGCTAYDIKSEQPIGKFCADVGKVSISLMEEVKRANPDFPKWAKKHDWCVTEIPNFEGEAYILHITFPEGLYGKDEPVAFVVALGSQDVICWQTEM